MTHEIRELHLGDESKLLELFTCVSQGFFDRLAPDASGPGLFLEDPGSFVFGAYVDDVPAGLAWGIQIRYPSGRLVSYLHELDVREEFRRRRIGTALVEASMKKARTAGSERFWLSTGGHNEIAQKLYESLDGERKPLGDVNYWWEFE